MWYYTRNTFPRNSTTVRATLPHQGFVEKLPLVKIILAHAERLSIEIITSIITICRINKYLSTDTTMDFRYVSASLSSAPHYSPTASPSGQKDSYVDGHLRHP